MPHASTRALGPDVQDRRRKDQRIESSDVSRIRHEVSRDMTAATRAGGAITIAARVDALTSPVTLPRDEADHAERVRQFQVRDHLATIATLMESRRRVASALALSCDDHDARPGTHCWGSPGSATRGLCTDRYLRGLRGITAVAR